VHQNTKSYGHELGLSCAFRQWRATSHCNQIHGYAIAVKFVFEAKELDHNGWVVDFGSLKFVKDWLQETFDHKLLVAVDDPLKEELIRLYDLGLAAVKLVERTGCEAFAKMIHEYVAPEIHTVYRGRVRLVSVEVAEHGANSAIYIGDIQ
jgi:6-pyruvoyltetrahydropterin/6-carboxytetrahydropterin synthase